MDAVVANKCYNCGKTFRNEAEYNRHKNRKTPCLIRDIKQEDLMNPNRCIYCNKIYSKKEHLTRHHKTCKIKNGGMNMLFDKVKYEETIRIMQEEHAREREKNERKQEANDRLLTEMQKKMEEMEKKMEELQKNPPQTTINNGPVINGNGNNVLVINNVSTPQAEHLLEFNSFRKMLGLYGRDLPMEIVLSVYFDPSHPENASVHLIDKDTKQVIAMENGVWNTFSMENIVEKMRNAGYNIAANGFRSLAGGGSIEQTEFIKNNIEFIRNLPVHKMSHETIKYESREIEKKLISEYDTSSKHPSVIIEQQRRKRAITVARIQ